jgi:hypothetical protein
MTKTTWGTLAAIALLPSLAAAAPAPTPQLRISCGFSPADTMTFVEFPPGLGETVRQFCVDKGDKYGVDVRIHISGEITPKLSAAGIEVLRVSKGFKTKALGMVRVTIDSDGGDVDSALELGNAMFEQRANAMTSRCYGECVLVVAGAIFRSYVGFDGTVVGVHRPFQAQVSKRSASAREFASKYEAVERKIRNWFREMGVSQQLADLMMSTPSGSNRLLTKQELNDFGLGSTNVVDSEMLREHRVEGCDPHQAKQRQAAFSEISECWRRAAEKVGATTAGGNADRACQNAANRKYGVNVGQKCSASKH